MTDAAFEGAKIMANVIIIIIMVIMTVQNSAYLVQLIQSIRTRFKEPMGKGSKLDIWARHAQYSVPVSIIAPAFNEELTIDESIRALLSVNYPVFEVIVVNDGSSDRTLQKLIKSFSMNKSNRSPVAALTHNPVHGVYTSSVHPRLLVIDKVNGRKADAVNAGITYARHPLICVTDADSIIEADGMLRITEPFLTDNGDLVAVGGSIRITNGCDVQGGRVLDVVLPKNWFARFQILEYLRAFIVARVATSQWSMMMLISGAFGVFKRTAVIEAGGFRHDTVGEDLEFVVRLQRTAIEAGRKCRVAYVPDAICWTEAPSTFAGLKGQRARWEQGALETLQRHRTMIFNPRYGRIGMVAMPLMVLEDICVPVAELLGYVLFPMFLWLGITSPGTFIAFLAFSFLFGTMMSLSALAHEEFQFRKADRVRDLATLTLCAFLENFGYRQANFAFRILGMWKRYKGDTAWAIVPRVGFAKKRAS